MCSSKTEIYFTDVRRPLRKQIEETTFEEKNAKIITEPPPLDGLKTLLVLFGNNSSSIRGHLVHPR